MEEKIYEAYYEACRKYYFNRRFGRGKEIEYFRGQMHSLASLLGGDNDRLIELRDMAMTQADEDYGYFTY